MNKIEQTINAALDRATTTLAAKQPATAAEPTTYTSVEYRAGWIGTDGRWHVFTAYPASETLEDALADLELAKVRYKGPGIVAEVKRAVKAGRVEVRTRTIVRTSWEVPA